MPLFREHSTVRRAWSALSSTSQRLVRATASRSHLLPCAAAATFAMLPLDANCEAEDRVQSLQTKAIEEKRADFGHWGIDPENYLQWSSHSNRLIPVYTFGTKGQGTGVDLDSYQGANSPYRSEAAIQRLYGQVPPPPVQTGGAATPGLLADRMPIRKLDSVPPPGGYFQSLPVLLKVDSRTRLWGPGINTPGPGGVFRFRL